MLTRIWPYVVTYQSNPLEFRITFANRIRDEVSIYPVSLGANLCEVPGDSISYYNRHITHVYSEHEGDL